MTEKDLLIQELRCVIVDLQAQNEELEMRLVRAERILKVISTLLEDR